MNQAPAGEHSQHPSWGWGFPPYGIIGARGAHRWGGIGGSRRRARRTPPWDPRDRDRLGGHAAAARRGHRLTPGRWSRRGTAPRGRTRWRTCDPTADLARSEPALGLPAGSPCSAARPTRCTRPGPHGGSPGGELHARALAWSLARAQRSSGRPGRRAGGLPGRPRSPCSPTPSCWPAPDSPGPPTGQAADRVAHARRPCWLRRGSRTCLSAAALAAGDQAYRATTPDPRRVPCSTPGRR